MNIPIMYISPKTAFKMVLHPSQIPEFYANDNLLFNNVNVTQYHCLFKNKDNSYLRET